MFLNYIYIYKFILSRDRTGNHWIESADNRYTMEVDETNMKIVLYVSNPTPNPNPNPTLNLKTNPNVTNPTLS